MKFSIIVPVYNAEKFLAQTIESVLAQTYQDYELILVNDGSKDASGEICDEYAQKYVNIKSFHKANSGCVETRCYGVERSEGDYIVSLDSDDLLAPRALEIVDNKLTQYNCDMLIFDFQRFVEKSELCAKDNDFVSDVIVDNKRVLCLRILMDAAYNSIWRKVVRRKFWCQQKVSVLHGEDLFLTLPIIEQNPKTVFISDILYYYRMNPQSVVHSGNIEKLVDDTLFVRNCVVEFLQKNSKMFLENDWQEFRSYMTEWFVNIIYKVLRNSNISWKRKIELLEQIRTSSFFDFLVEEGWQSIRSKKWNFKTRLLWYHYNLRKYRTLRAIINCAKCLAR